MLLWTKAQNTNSMFCSISVLYVVNSLRYNIILRRTSLSKPKQYNKGSELPILLTKFVPTILLFVVKVHQSEAAIPGRLHILNPHVCKTQFCNQSVCLCVCVCVCLYPYMVPYVGHIGRLAIVISVVCPLFSRTLHTIEVWSVTATAGLSQCTDLSSEMWCPTCAEKSVCSTCFLVELISFFFFLFFFKENLWKLSGVKCCCPQEYIW